jgi:hypothetical protein
LRVLAAIARAADGVHGDNVARGEGGRAKDYVGGSKEHSEYQRLRVQRQIAADQAWAAREAQVDWGMWEPWW